MSVSREPLGSDRPKLDAANVWGRLLTSEPVLRLSEKQQRLFALLHTSRGTDQLDQLSKDR